MDAFVLAMIVLVSLIMNGAMAWLVFGKGPSDRGQTTMTEIVNLLNRLDRLDMLKTGGNASVASDHGEAAEATDGLITRERYLRGA